MNIANYFQIFPCRETRRQRVTGGEGGDGKYHCYRRLLLHLQLESFDLLELLETISSRLAEQQACTVGDRLRKCELPVFPCCAETWMSISNLPNGRGLHAQQFTTVTHEGNVPCSWTSIVNSLIGWALLFRTGSPFILKSLTQRIRLRELNDCSVQFYPPPAPSTPKQSVLGFLHINTLSSSSSSSSSFLFPLNELTARTREVKCSILPLYRPGNFP